MPLRLLTVALLLAASPSALAQSALIDAARSDDAATAARLIADGADPSAPDDSGRTPLAVAAAFDAPAVAALLLGAGADPDAAPPNAYGEPTATPLFWAFNGGVEASVAPLLLAAGADAFAPVPLSDLPTIAIAAREGHLGVVLPYLRAHPDAVVPAMLPLAAARGDAAGVDSLLALGVALDGVLYGDRPALHAAATRPGEYLLDDLGDAYDAVGVVQRLLAAGLDPNADGCAEVCGTPLHVAAWEGRADVVAALLAGGGDPARTTDFFGDALDAASVARARLDGLADEDGYGPAPTAAELRATLAVLE